jgi:hypothetical protein
MDGDIISCMPGNPYRKPMWRWDRARQPGGNRLSVRFQVEDEWVERARRYLTDGLPTPKGGRRPRKSSDPAIQAAASVNDKGGQRKWRLEALVLADEPGVFIAKQCRLTAEAVVAYEALFFDVRDHLAARDWIVGRVLESLAPDRLREESPASLWRCAAYFGGAPILEMVIAVTTNRPLPAWSRERLPEGFADDLEYAEYLRGSCQLWVESLLAETPSQWAEYGINAKAFAARFPSVAVAVGSMLRVEHYCDALALLDPEIIQQSTDLEDKQKRSAGRGTQCERPGDSPRAARPSEPS